MDSAAMTQLEAASLVFMAPASVVNPQQRQMAENIILDFRKIKSPYQLCKNILESSASDYILFEAVGLLKSAIIKEWSDLNDVDVLSLRSYLMQYILQKQLPPFVREKILQLMAIMVKRLSLDDHGIERRKLLDEAQRLIQEGPLSSNSALGCSILLALIQEHSITVRSADLGLPWAQHFKLKNQFEAIELKTIFNFAMKALQELERTEATSAPIGINLAEKLLTVAEAALCWGHVSPLLPRRLVGVFEAVHESDAAPALRRSLAWRPLLADPALPALLGALALRGHPLMRPALSSLGQLASLNGAALAEEDRGGHALRIASSLFPLLSTSPTPAAASALRRLCLHSPKELLALPAVHLTHLLDTLARYVASLVHMATLEEAGSDEETLCTEALEASLEAWVGLLHAAVQPAALDIDGPGPLCPSFAEGSVHIFDALLMARLAPPDGNRSAGVEGESEVEEEGMDLERCESILQLTGAIGRFVPHHSLPLVGRVIEARTDRMHALMRMGVDSPDLCNVYEDLHWTLLFAGHVLTIEGDGDGDGETPSIPGELVRYSAHAGGDPDASLRLLRNIHSQPHPDDLQAADHIIRIIWGVWRLCGACGWSSDAWGWQASPALAADCAWLMRRWLRSYLLPAPCTGIGQLSGRALRAAWARGGGADVAPAVERLAQGAYSTLRALPGDAHTTKRAVALIAAVSAINHAEAKVARCEILAESFRWGLGEDGLRLEAGARRGIAKAAVHATADMSDAERIARLDLVLAFSQRALLDARGPADPRLLAALDIFAGIADGAVFSSAKCVWEYIRPALEASVRLAGEVGWREGGACGGALRLAAASATALPCLLPAEAAACLLFTLTRLLDAHSAMPPPSSRHSDSRGTQEDEFCEEISLVMEIVSGIADSSWLLGLKEGSEALKASHAGARALLPRLAPPSPLLQRPQIAHRYYRLLQDLGSFVICSLEDEYFNAVMVSLSEGVGGNEGSGPVCTLLAELAMAARDDAHPRLTAALEPLASQLLSLCLSGAMREALRGASAALYQLAVSLPRLRDALPASLGACAFDAQRHDALKFRDEFDKFIAEAQGSHLIA